ncbi:MAG TPA: DUF5655 domain-containing protein [Chloroflexia bacterium]|nr:DUF5655 domain-containing protein [Chloroflexia bacterium]
MTNLGPELQDLLEQLRQVALSYADAEEYFPWKNRAFFRELKGRNFLFINEQSDYLEIIFRVPLHQKEQIIKEDFVAPHQSMKSWLRAEITSREQMDKVIPWIKTSYELSKPIRTKEDLLEGEPPEIIDFLAQVRREALSYEDIEEYFPFGDRAFRKRKGQIFLYAGEGDDHLYVNVRLPFGERDYALTLPFIEVPKYIGHKGWVGAKIRTQDELDTVLPWIQISYELNRPVRKRKAGLL